MNILKKALGLFWMMLGPAAILFLFMQALEKTKLAEPGIAQTNTALQWGIILFIFIPIGAGLVIFGYYALTGAYEQLAEEDL